MRSGLLKVDLHVVDIILKLLSIFKICFIINGESVLLIKLILQLPIVVIGIIKVLLDFHIELFGFLDISSEEVDLLLKLLIVNSVVISLGMELLTFFSQPKELILHTIILVLKLRSSGI